MKSRGQYAWLVLALTLTSAFAHADAPKETPKQAPKEAVLRVWINGTVDVHFRLADGMVATRDGGRERTAPIDSLNLRSSRPKEFLLDISPKPEHAATMTNLDRVREITFKRFQEQGKGEFMPLNGPFVRGWYYTQLKGFVWDKEYTSGFAGYVVVDGVLPIMFGLSYNESGKAGALQALQSLRLAYIPH